MFTDPFFFFRMKPLKTLKDIGNPRDVILGSVKEVIKAEAIKWVKVFDKDIRENKKVSIGEREYLSGLFAVREWIIMFFNITSEDLAWRINK